MHEPTHLNADDPKAFNLNEEMVSRIGQEFDFVKAAQSFSQQVKGKADDEIQKTAKELFGDFGRRLVIQCMEEEEKNPDMTYQTLKEYLEKTGMDIFPLVPQTFIEIAFLSAMPIYEIKVIQNNADKLTYQLPDCQIYKELTEDLGQAQADKLPCRFGCLALNETIIEKLNLNAEAVMEAEQSKDGKCRFSLVAKK